MISDPCCRFFQLHLSYHVLLLRIVLINRSHPLSPFFVQPPSEVHKRAVLLVLMKAVLYEHTPMNTFRGDMQLNIVCHMYFSSGRTEYVIACSLYLTHILFLFIALAQNPQFAISSLGVMPSTSQKEASVTLVRTTLLYLIASTYTLFLSVVLYYTVTVFVLLSSHFPSKILCFCTLPSCILSHWKFPLIAYFSRCVLIHNGFCQLRTLTHMSYCWFQPLWLPDLITSCLEVPLYLPHKGSLAAVIIHMQL